MGFRFSRRIALFPGVSMNFGKTGASFSLGPRGMKTTIKPGKGIRHSFGIPGTGLSYQTSYKKWGDAPASPVSSRPALSPAEREELIRQNDSRKLDLGFFAKLILSREEKSLAGGIQAYLAGDMSKAEALLKQAICYADAAFTLGFLYLNNNRFDDAIQMLELAARNPTQIGTFYRKYQLSMTLTLTISPFLTVELPADPLTASLGHAEALQQRKRVPEACNLLLSLYKENPQNILVLASLAELVLEFSPDNLEWMNAIADMTKNIENDSYPHTVLLMYKAEAFDNLGLFDAAIATLTSALRKKSGRPDELLLELQYQRGVLYAKTGKKALAAKDLNSVFARDPDYADVRRLLS